MFRLLFSLIIKVFLLGFKFCQGEACVDNVPQCPYWANAGECYHNPRYMSLQCALSCNTAVVCGRDTNDTDKLCWHKASTGFCEYDPDGGMSKCNTTCTTRRETFCETPINVTNAHYKVRESYRFMDILDYQCDLGYEKTNSFHQGRHTCSDSGVWLRRTAGYSPWKYPTCVEISCGDPPVLNNTNVSYTGIVYNEEVKYTCLEGYSPVSGDSLRVCQLDKTWNGTDLICQENPEPVLQTSYFPWTTSSFSLMAVDVMTTSVMLQPTPVESLSDVTQETVSTFYYSHAHSTTIETQLESSTWLGFHTAPDNASASSPVLATPTPSVPLLSRLSEVSYSLVMKTAYSSLNSIETSFQMDLDSQTMKDNEIGETTVYFSTLSVTQSEVTSLTALSFSENIVYSEIEQSAISSTETGSELTSSSVVDQVTESSTGQSSAIVTQPTISVTPSQSETGTRKCKCRCNANSTHPHGNSTSASIEAIMNMTKTVKKFTPKLAEAEGAVYVGASAIVILGTIFGGIILLDSVTIVRHFKILWQNCMSKNKIVTENDLWKN